MYDYNKGSGVFIQVGAGAGDLDKKANYRDGFTELVKKLPRERVKKIILVESNPLNIPSLSECWKDYPESSVHQIRIVPKNCQKEVTDLEKVNVTFKRLENFINEVTADEIELLALDVDGVDADIILDTNFNNLRVKYLSFEYPHLGGNRDSVLKHLECNNYEFIGSGVDHNGYDYLYINRRFKNTVI